MAPEALQKAPGDALEASAGPRNDLQSVDEPGEAPRSAPETLPGGPWEAPGSSRDVPGSFWGAPGASRRSFWQLFGPPRTQLELKWRKYGFCYTSQAKTCFFEVRGIENPSEVAPQRSLGSSVELARVAPSVFEGVAARKVLPKGSATQPNSPEPK